MFLTHLVGPKFTIKSSISNLLGNDIVHTKTRCPIIFSLQNYHFTLALPLIQINLFNQGHSSIQSLIYPFANFYSANVVRSIFSTSAISHQPKEFLTSLANLSPTKANSYWLKKILLFFYILEK